MGLGRTKRTSNIERSTTNDERKIKIISNIQHSISNNQRRTLPWAGTSVARVMPLVRFYHGSTGTLLSVFALRASPNTVSSTIQSQMQKMS